MLARVERQFKGAARFHDRDSLPPGIAIDDIGRKGGEGGKDKGGAEA
jgi:hypothetical protein